MPALDPKLRSQLDSVCQKAREKAEEAARSALQKRAVDAAEPHAHFTPAEKGDRFEVDHRDTFFMRDGLAVYIAPGGVPVIFDHESVNQFIVAI